MKRQDHDRLLREILADEKVEGLREASLSQGLGQLRQRRRRRAVLSGVTASLAVAMIALVISRRMTPQRSSEIVPEVMSPPNTPKVTVISDDQLLALFSERPVALVGAPGNQQLLFLDQRSDASAAAKTR